MAATYMETGSGTTAAITGVPAKWKEKLFEGFWFSICLFLFLILGPFAAPIVLCFMFSNNLRDCEMQEPESVN